MLALGQHLGHYRIVRMIGSGGMGEVYLAEDTRIPRQVAVKVIRQEPVVYTNQQTLQETLRLFHREMRVISMLDHPNILHLIEQDHRFLKGRVKPGLGVVSFETAWRTLQGYEMMNMIRKGQVQGVNTADNRGQIALVAKLLGVVAYTEQGEELHAHLVLFFFLATQPMGSHWHTQVLGLQALHRRVLRLLGPAYSQFYFFSP